MDQAPSAARDRRIDPERPTWSPEKREEFRRFMAAIGARCYYERKEVRGWSLEKLADASGRDPWTIDALERGRSNPRLDTVIDIALPLGISLAAAVASLKPRT